MSATSPVPSWFLQWAAPDEDDDRRGNRRGHGRPHQGGPHFGGPGSGRRRAARGNVHKAVLGLLAEEPQHGYALIGLLAERSGGLWRPSPGSIYPVLAHLERSGLVTSEEADGRRTFTITDKGRAHLTSTSPDISELWASFGTGRRRGATSLSDGVRSLGSAAREVAHNGTEAQVQRARTILDDARKALYRLLAEDETPSADQP